MLYWPWLMNLAVMGVVKSIPLSGLRRESMRRWFSHLRESYKHGPVTVLGIIGLLALLGGLFTDGWLQSVLIEIGAALLLIPPLVATERLVLAEDVEEITQRALKEISSLRQDIEREHTDLLDLFREESEFRVVEALPCVPEQTETTLP